MIFELSKPLCDWKLTHTNDSLELSQEVVVWLREQNIKYDAYAKSEYRTINGPTFLYIAFYIDIFDDKDAILFKLTWM